MPFWLDTCAVERPVFDMFVLWRVEDAGVDSRWQGEDCLG